MIENQKMKIYFIFFLVFLLLVVFVILTILTSNKKSPNYPNSIQTIKIPSPTIIPTQPPTIPPEKFTGVDESYLMPDDVAKRASQKQTLRQKTPLNLPYFLIDFNYGEDKFTLSLKDPKANSLKIFNQWLTENYPNLKQSDFTLK